MTEIDTDKLRALDVAARNATPAVRVYRGALRDSYLATLVPDILAMAEENQRLREALDRIKRIAAGYDPDGSDYDEGFFEGQRNMANIARRALGKDKA